MSYLSIFDSILKFPGKINLKNLIGIDNDPDLPDPYQHVLDANPDPDPNPDLAK